METPQGTLELKSFFSVGLQLNDDESSQSSAAVKFKIKKLIECENPQKPISDDEIVATLKVDGINVARRTVAKYRKENRYVANLINANPNKRPGEVIFGDSMSGIKGYFATVKISTDQSTDTGGPKELFAVGSNFVVSSY